MTENDYQPVSCEMHSELELAIMHRTELQLSWQSEDALLTETVLPVDIKTKNKQEFLYTRTKKGDSLEIRLDKISTFTPA